MRDLTHMEGMTLKEYVTLKFEALETATTLAREAMNKRLDGMNEFRETLKDQASKFITRPEHDVLIKDINELREFRIKLESKADQSQVNRALLISIIGIVLAILSFISRWIK